MRKIDIATQVAETCGLSKAKATQVVETVIETISQSLINGESVYLRGFGTFRPRTTKGKTARNIATGEPIVLPARHTAKLIPSKGLIKNMNR